jgi:hypothetical protein
MAVLDQDGARFVVDGGVLRLMVSAGPAQKERNPGGGTPGFLEIGGSGGTDLIWTNHF